MVRIGGLAESTQRRRAYITQIAACYKVVIVMENSNDKWKKWFGDAPDGTLENSGDKWTKWFGEAPKEISENSGNKWKKWFGDAPDDSDYEWESDDGVLFPPDIGIGASVSYKGYSFVE